MDRLSRSVFITVHSQSVKIMSVVSAAGFHLTTKVLHAATRWVFFISHRSDSHERIWGHIQSFNSTQLLPKTTGYDIFPKEPVKNREILRLFNAFKDKVRQFKFFTLIYLSFCSPCSVAVCLYLSKHTQIPNVCTLN